ncbi:MAG: hypothetical protein WKG07_16775 [Hymenobacter sp.]
MRLLGLSGSVEEGLRNLGLAASQPNDFQVESQILQALIREAYYNKGDESRVLTSRLAREQPDNLLFSYLVISLNKRQHYGDEALAAYRSRPTGPAYLPLPLLHHLAGDLLLYRGEYEASNAENQRFLHEYRGEYYRKDAAFKLYLAAWLGHAPAATAAAYRQQINQAGPLTIEEDAYAQRFYHDAQPLDPILHPRPPTHRWRLLYVGIEYVAAIPTRGHHTGARPTRSTLPPGAGVAGPEPPRFGPRRLPAHAAPLGGAGRAGLLLRAAGGVAARLSGAGGRPAPGG